MKDTVRILRDNEFLDFGHVMALILYKLVTPENMVLFKEEALPGNTIYSQKWIFQHVASGKPQNYVCGSAQVGFFCGLGLGHYSKEKVDI